MPAGYSKRWARACSAAPAARRLGACPKHALAARTEVVQSAGRHRRRHSNGEVKDIAARHGLAPSLTARVVILGGKLSDEISRELWSLSQSAWPWRELLRLLRQKRRQTGLHPPMVVQHHGIAYKVNEGVAPFSHKGSVGASLAAVRMQPEGVEFVRETLSSSRLERICSRRQRP